jgi:hypothetical protein
VLDIQNSQSPESRSESWSLVDGKAWTIDFFLCVFVGPTLRWNCGVAIRKPLKPEICKGGISRRSGRRIGVVQSTSEFGSLEHCVLERVDLSKPEFPKSIPTIDWSGCCESLIPVVVRHSVTLVFGRIGVLFC